MSFQTAVNLYPAPAVAGDRASQNPIVYMPYNFLAGDSAVAVGGFVWADSTHPTTEVVSSGSGKPLGFVERELNKPLYNLNSEGSLILPEGAELAVAVRGDFWVVGENAATVGKAVFVKSADGSKIKFNNSGETMSGYVETDFKALTAGSAGDLVIIGNW